MSADRLIDDDTSAKGLINVLLVDDSEDDYILTRDWLTDVPGTQFEIDWAMSFDEGLEAYAKGSHDVCLIDYRLGHRTGLEWMQERTPTVEKIPFIMLTGMGTRSTDIKAMECGVSDYLEKDAINGPLLERAIRYSLEKHRLVRELHNLSKTDTLTGIANRLMFQEALASGIASVARHSRQLALLCIDLDNFKEVNDSLGHGFGDQVLYQIAHRLSRITRTEDLVARLGGDEFALLLSEIDEPGDVVLVAEKVLREVSLPVKHQGHLVTMSGSVGIAIGDGGLPASQIFDAADMAMYEAKKRGRNQYCYFDSNMQAQASRRATIESDLQSAIARGQLRLHYQPQVDARTGEVNSVEALIRWNHPNLGFLSPAEFIPLAESTQMICTLGEWVLAEGCRQLAQWHQVRPSLRLAVNVSPRHLENKWFLEGVKQTINDSGIPPSCIELEITETTVMENPEEVVSKLLELNKFGVRFAIDDFGTGYSSLANLRQLPVAVLKLDRSFVWGIGNSPDDETIVIASLGMASSMGLEVVAEGVETLDQAAFLLKHNCFNHQGFLYYKPLDAGQIRKGLLTTSPAANTALAQVHKLSSASSGT
ncbi:MAG: EAL domain-containing protein [Lysobacterales bacterium]